MPINQSDLNFFEEMEQMMVSMDVKEVNMRQFAKLSKKCGSV